MGATATLPTDTITVIAFTDNILPKATKPSDPDTHWASAAVKQCATGASHQGKWEVALANGGTASEAKSFIDGELPNALVRDDVDMLAAGDCVSGNVYFFMPDGATTASTTTRRLARSPHPTTRATTRRSSQRSEDRAN